MNLKKALPYILATLLLGLLLSMAQTPRVLIRAKTSARDVHAQDSARSDYFYLPVGSTQVSSLTESDYQGVVQKFMARYFSKVYHQTGLPLIIPNEWSSPYFAAFASKKEGYMQISLWGGMARAPGSNKAILATILCHELGHVLGGEPLQTIPGADWASTEGQSDFYASSVCMPDFFTAHPELAPIPSPRALELCHENKMCGQVLQAGFETVQFFQAYAYKEIIPVSLDTVASATKELVRNSYPSDQCRLDTYVAGAYCQLGSRCRAPLCWLPHE